MKKRPSSDATPPISADPAELARQAMAESALALRESRHADAKALSALAEIYGRIAERRAAAPASGPFDEERLDAAGEQALRDELLRRLDALAEDIEANGGVRP